MNGTRWFLRIALAAGFLSAAADRVGLWGAPGTPGVAWGEWSIACASGLLLLLFALAMAIAEGIKSPLDSSVFAAAAAAFLLAAVTADENRSY